MVAGTSRNMTPPHAAAVQPKAMPARISGDRAVDDQTGLLDELADRGKPSRARIGLRGFDHVAADHRAGDHHEGVDHDHDEQQLAILVGVTINASHANAAKVALIRM